MRGMLRKKVFSRPPEIYIHFTGTDFQGLKVNDRTYYLVAIAGTIILVHSHSCQITATYLKTLYTWNLWVPDFRKSSSDSMKW